MLRTTGPGTHFNSRLKLGAGLWAGLLSWYCQLELEVTITDVVNLWQSPSLSDHIMSCEKFATYPYNCNVSQA